jgi:type I restriction enzyme, S subunit
MELVAEQYKQTEVGLIPSDWQVKELDTILTFGSGRDYKQLQIGEIPVYGTGGIMTYVNDFLYDGESVGIGRKGTIDKPVFLKGKFWTVDTLFYTYQFINANPKFIYYKFCLIKWKEYNEASGVPSLNKNTLQKIKIALPELTEQTAIATALSDADALISSLEKLIAKKRNIKQGAMQKLLQPKEGWDTKTLKELAKYRRGSFPQPYGLDKWYDDTNGYPFVQVYDVDDNFRLKNETKRRISKEAQEMSVFIEKGSVIITLQGSIGRIAITQYDAYVDRTLLFFESFIVPFDKFFFMLSIFRLFELEKEKAPGGIIKTITKEALSSFKISYPKIEEQTEIATILSDMDAEISALETKLEKYKKVKLGMMQHLLTGKIRLNQDLQDSGINKIKKD